MISLFGLTTLGTCLESLLAGFKLVVSKLFNQYINKNNFDYHHWQFILIYHPLAYPWVVQVLYRKCSLQNKKVTEQNILIAFNFKKPTFTESGTSQVRLNLSF